MTIKRAIAVKCVQYRTSKGISQQEFAQRLKITRGQLAHYERAASEPPLSVIVSLIRVTGYSFFDLLNIPDFSLLNHKS